MKMICEAKQKLSHSHSLLLSASTPLLQELDFAFEPFLFLLRYSFLLNDTSTPQNSRVQKTPQLNALQGNIYGYTIPGPQVFAVD